MGGKRDELLKELGRQIKFDIQRVSDVNNEYGPRFRNFLPLPLLKY